MFGLFKKNALPPKTVVEIERLSSLGNLQLEEENFSGAYESFTQALDLLPDPKEKWPEATWLFAALGDMYFQSRNYDQAMQAFNDAMHCPQAIGNPYLHLKLGQCQYEVSNFDRAADELTRAYMGGGAEIFSQDDPKYFDFLKTKISPPTSGVW
jgi:tetratricopeptide (TPR) repeat protein